MIEIKLNIPFEFEFQFLYMDNPKSRELAEQMILDQLAMFYFHDYGIAKSQFRDAIDININKDCCVTYHGKTIFACKIIPHKRGLSFKCVGTPVGDVVVRLYD